MLKLMYIIFVLLFCVVNAKDISVSLQSCGGNTYYPGATAKKCDYISKQVDFTVSASEPTNVLFDLTDIKHDDRKYAVAVYPVNYDVGGQTSSARFTFTIELIAQSSEKSFVSSSWTCGSNLGTYNCLNYTENQQGVRLCNPTETKWIAKVTYSQGTVDTDWITLALVIATGVNAPVSGYEDCPSKNILQTILLAVLIPFGVITIGLVIFFYIRHVKRNKALASSEPLLK